MAVDFKDEEQVKEFIEKLGIEYRFGCYQEKNSEACHLLGDYLEAIKKDFSKASRVYMTNCDDLNFGKSCYKYGRYLLLNKGKKETDAESTQKAFKYFSKACERGDSNGCYTSAVMLINPNSFLEIQKNAKKGIEDLEKACNADHPLSCFYLAGMYITGVKNDGKRPNDENNKSENNEKYEITRDMKKAFELTKKACDLSNLQACVNLSIMYKRGDGTEKNEKLAEKYKNIALEMQEEFKKQKETLKFQQGID